MTARTPVQGEIDGARIHLDAWRRRRGRCSTHNTRENFEGGKISGTIDCEKAVLEREVSSAYVPSFCTCQACDYCIRRWGCVLIEKDSKVAELCQLVVSANGVCLWAAEIRHTSHQVRFAPLSLRGHSGGIFAACITFSCITTRTLLGVASITTLNPSSDPAQTPRRLSPSKWHNLQVSILTLQHLNNSLVPFC